MDSYQVDNLISAVSVASTVQQDTLNTMSLIMMQSILSSLSNNDSDLIDKKEIKSLVMERIVDGIYNGSMDISIRNALGDEFKNLIQDKESVVNAAGIKAISERIEENLKDIIGYQFENKIKKIGEEALDKWLESNREGIEEKALKLVEKHLESAFTEQLARSMLKELSQTIIQKKFHHLLK